MLIALDYDDTFTLDPEQWCLLSETFQKRGHRLIGVTMRYEYEKESMLLEYFVACSDVYYTGRTAKMPYLASRGIFPDVWIDDKPHFILHDAANRY